MGAVKGYDDHNLGYIAQYCSILLKKVQLFTRQRLSGVSTVIRVLSASIFSASIFSASIFANCNFFSANSLELHFDCA